MAKNTGGNAANENTEQINAQKPKKADESLTTRAIRGFIEHRLHGDDGGENFNEIISNKGNGLSEDFLKFIATKPELHEQSDVQKEAFRNVNSAQFLSESVRIGVGFENKQEALENLLSEEYEGLTLKDIKKCATRIQWLSLDNLTYYLRNSSERHKFITITLPEVPLKKKDFLAFLNNIQIKGVNLDEKQKQAIRGLRDLNHIDEDILRDILPKFSFEQKQLLIRAFLPTVSLWELVRMGLIAETEARKVVADKIGAGKILASLWEKWSEITGFIRNIDLDQIVIPTKLFPEDVVDRIISLGWVKQIKKELDTLFDEVKQEERDEFGLTPDRDGKYLSSFIDKVKKEILGKNNKCRIENIDSFWPGTILQGSISKGSNIERIFIRIDSVNEESVNTTGQKSFNITHLTGPNGTIIKNPSASKKEPDVSFQDMFRVLSTVNEGKILKSTELDGLVTDKKIQEIVEDSDIKKLSELNAKLDLIDPKGSEFSLSTGQKTSFMIHSGKPGFWVFTIQDIDEENHQLRVNNGNWIEGPYTFDVFFVNFREQNGSRFSPITSLDSSLEALKKGSKNAKSYKDIDIKDGKLIPNDRKDDKDFEGIKHFIGRDGILVEVVEIKGDKVKLSLHEWYNEKGNKSKSATTPTWYGWETFYMLHEEYECQPKTPPAPVKPEDTKALPEHRKHGFIKHYLWNASFHDIFGAGKQLIDFVKHKLEHNSKMNAAKMALTLGSWMGMNEEWLTDLRGSVHTNNKKMTDEMVTELNNLPTPLRHRRIRGIIMNHGSHDYEVHAAIISMLGKHGNLHAGGLKDLEGTYIWYTALGGKPNDRFMMETKENLAKKNEPFREEALIREWLKYKSSKEWGYQVDGNLWVKGVKLPWREGIENEMKSGEWEAESLYSLDGRMDHVFDKLKNKEYANGIGAMKKVWATWGSPAQMQESTFILAMSDIPEHLAQNQLKGLWDEFYAGHTYPGLLFVKSPADQDLFRKIVKKLAKNSSEAENDYMKIEKLLSSDPDKKLVDEIRNFWRKHGSLLAPKLAITQDPEIFWKKDSDNDFKEYYTKISSALDDVSKIDGGEADNGMYGYKHSGFALANMKRYVKEVDVNAGNGNMNNDKEKYFFEQLIEGIEDIRNKKIHTNPSTPKEEEENKEFQKKIYWEYHLSILSRLSNRLNGDAFEKLNTQPYMKELIKRWFSKPETNDTDQLKWVIYDEHLNRDFEKYLSTRHTISETEDKTLDSLVKILEIDN